MKNKEKIIKGASIVGILIVFVILVSVISNDKQTEKNKEPLENIELSELINIKDINNISYETEKTEEKISSKYIAVRNKYEVKADVKLGKITGKVIYVRGVDNINVYKIENTLNKYEDINTQVSGIIQTLEENCKSYMGINEEYEETEMLYGESNAKFELPLEESIYDEGRLYSKTYKSEENEYDINFYKEENKIICEFVKKI